MQELLLCESPGGDVTRNVSAAAHRDSQRESFTAQQACLAALTAPLMTRGQISPSAVSLPKMNMNVIDTWVLPASENKWLGDYKKENL